MSAFDLDQFAPAPIKFKVRGISYSVHGDVDVDDVARMLRIENALSEAEGIEATVAVVAEGRDILLELIQQRDSSVQSIKIGAQDLMIVFALILHGSSVAAAVAEAMSPPPRALGEADEAVATREGASDEDGPGADDAPLASAKLSSGRSSSSDEPVAGPLATGSV